MPDNVSQHGLFPANMFSFEGRGRRWLKEPYLRTEVQVDWLSS